MSPSSFNRCIYCLKVGVPLSREHVIPEGLGGTLILERASCYDCANQVRSFEPFCIRNIYESSRTFFKVKSKKKHAPRQRNLPAGIGEPVERKWVQADFDTYPFAMGVPAMPPAPLLKGVIKESSEQTITQIHYWASEEFLKRMEAFAAKGNGRAAIFTLFELGRFERFMAKIAHGYAVAELGIDGFSPLATNFIRSIPDPLSFSLVGEALEPIKKHSPNLHEMDVHYLGDLVTVRIQLFAPIAGAITYQVVVGKRLIELSEPIQVA